MSVNDITGMIVDAALQIYKDLGPGLLESVYEAVLAKKMAERGLRVERQKAWRSTKGFGWICSSKTKWWWN